MGLLVPHLSIDECHNNYLATWPHVMLISVQCYSFVIMTANIWLRLILITASVAAETDGEWCLDTKQLRLGSALERIDTGHLVSRRQSV